MKLVPPAGATGLVSCSASGRVYYINGRDPIEIDPVDLSALLRAGFTHVTITDAVAALTDRVTVYRSVKKVSNMDRVTEKLKLAAGVVARSNAGLEAEADRLIAREEAFEHRKRKAFAPHHAILDGRHRQMDQLEDQLQIVSNGDPLDGSGDTSDGEEAPKVETTTEVKS